ncbi:LVIVD repeat-containing protein [Haladaptatus sp. GCM10025893]|uniref:LVIVD repeat-containing protein n=1 Tax=Haladaptatus sp. GCM10025893 TaxID=3252659 RepID=UPI00360BC473
MPSNHTTRRQALKLLGASAVAAGGMGVASAKQDDRTLSLLGEVGVSGITEVTTQGTYAYAATNDGLAVVDWRKPHDPELLVDMEVPGAGVWDVKVDGDLLAISSQGSEEHDHGDGDGDEDRAPEDEIGTHFYDISDPANPEFQGTWQVLPEGVHNHYLVGDVCYIAKEAPFDDSELQIVDVSDPTNPSLLSRWAVEDDRPELDRETNFIHDVYVQGDYAYLAYWDAGTWVLDVSDPANPEAVSGFGMAPNADQAPNGNLWERLLTLPGNSHYVQPTPDGKYVFVGAETFPGGYVDNPDNDDYGGIKVFDVTDFDNPEQVARISPPDVEAFRTSHNFDVTSNRLYTSWYDGGLTVFNVTDPANPEELSRYDPDGSSFWGPSTSAGRPSRATSVAESCSSATTAANAPRRSSAGRGRATQRSSRHTAKNSRHSSFFERGRRRRGQSSHEPWMMTDVSTACRVCVETKGTAAGTPIRRHSGRYATNRTDEVRGTVTASHPRMDDWAARTYIYCPTF